jgi:hypothetical protein
MPKELLQKRKSLARSSGGFSGTTVRNSTSAQDVANLNSEELTDGLSELWTTSEEILKILIPTSFSSDIISVLRLSLQDTSSRVRKNYDTASKRFDAAISIYRNSDTSINVPLVVREILGVGQDSEVDEGPWRPDDILYRGNLALAARYIVGRFSNIYDSPTSTNLPPSLLESLFSGLVSATKPTRAGSTSLSKDTFELALELRTQLLIESIQKKYSGDSSQPILEHFYQGKSNTLGGWEIEGLRAENMGKSRREAILSRVSEIRKYLEVSQKAEYLQAQFPISQFVYNFISWAAARNIELQQRIASLKLSQPGVMGIQVAIDNEIQRRKGVNRSTSDHAQATLGAQSREKTTTNTSSTPSLAGNQKAKIRYVILFQL